MRFLAGGSCRDAIAEVRAAALDRLARCYGEALRRLWWARRGRRCVASAMILESAGRTGMLLYSPVSARGVEADALASLAERIAQEALRGGLCLVQALLLPDAAEDVAMLQSAGFGQLAELIYMRLDLTEALAAGDDPQLTWRHYQQFDPAELAEAITATYEGSLDCPALCGVRRASEAIAGHKATGIFRPQTWWIVAMDGSPAGCVLLNDSKTDDVCELVYLGVARSFRGRGLGRAMVRRAASEARARGRTAMTLAVDSQNVYARRLYEAEGFRVTDRRLAYAMLDRSERSERASEGLK